MIGQTGLAVNGAPVALDGFVAGFIEHTVAGMLRSLHGTADIGKLELAIAEDGQVNINLNNAQVPVNPFVSKIMGNTIRGMVSSLKGVSEASTVKIVIQH